MKNLLTRFFLSFLVLILISLILTAYITTQLGKRAASDILIELTQQTVSARADQIGGWLDQRMSELNVLAETERFQGLSEQQKAAEIENFAAAHARDFESVGLVLDDGRVLVSGGNIIDISGREYYLRMKSGDLDYVISRPIISRSDNSYIIVILKRSGDSIISGAILLSWLSDIAAKIEVRNQKAFILDQSGLIVAHHDKSMLMLPESELGGSGCCFRIEAEIPSSGSWLLAVDLPERVLFREINLMMRNLLLISSAMATIALLLALYLSGTLVKPIRNLQTLMFRAERGDMEVRAPARRLDEIGRLEKSFNSMIVQINSLMARIRQQQAELREKELESMMNQIKPHFLYNSLDSIRWMAEEDGNTRVADMIDTLARLFRISLSDGDELISLENELIQTESYLKLMRMRYSDVFDYNISVEGDASGFSVIKLIVQPVIENALKHGIRGGDGKQYRVEVVCTFLEEKLEISVMDNGRGFEPGFIEAWEKGKAGGYGMRNVSERLSIHFGIEYGIRLGYKQIEGERYTSVTIIHPVLPIARKGT